jgi:hypothetical protein
MRGHREGSPQQRFPPETESTSGAGPIKRFFMNGGVSLIKVAAVRRMWAGPSFPSSVAQSCGRNAAPLANTVARVSLSRSRFRAWLSVGFHRRAVLSEGVDDRHAVR